jgi:hypothetical protein
LFSKSVGRRCKLQTSRGSEKVRTGIFIAFTHKLSIKVIILKNYANKGT